MPTIRAAAASSRCALHAQRRHSVNGLWNVADYTYSGHIPPADEDVDHMFTITQPARVKLMTDVTGESGAKRNHSRHRMHWNPAVTNHNQAHLQEQIRKNDPSLSHVSLIDTADPAGIQGLWHYPFFFSTNEQVDIQNEMQAHFRDPEVSVRVKNTATIMRNTFRQDKTHNRAKDMRNSAAHSWAERNAPSIGQVGRRNLVHITDDTCTMQKPNFVHMLDSPQVAGALEKVWAYFGSDAPASTPDGASRRRDGSCGTAAPGSAGTAAGGARNEYHPRLDRPPNLVRCSEWLEQTSGMNAHVKKPEFGSYIGIINFHSVGVLQLCHPDGTVDWCIDDETPEGLTPASKVVLAPGSLTILKYDARWNIPYGYSYETEHYFRLQAFPKDYRASLMFCHYSGTHPGDAREGRMRADAGEGDDKLPSSMFDEPDTPLPKERDPAYAGRTERVGRVPTAHAL